MNHPKQYKIAQIYLKEFGYLNDEYEWKISILEVEKLHLMEKLNKIFFSQKNIENIAVEYGIFDNLYENFKNEEIFEYFTGKIETFYPKLMDEINVYSKLSPLNEHVLFQLIPNLICKVESFQELISDQLDSDSRSFFLNELAFYQNEVDFISQMNQLPINSQIEVVCTLIIEYISHRLSEFNYVILRDYRNRGWITCDNPVVIDHHIKGDSIFSLDTEIYFPLSKDFCLFFWNNNSDLENNILRTCENKSIIDANEDIQKIIFQKIMDNAQDVIFLPVGVKEINFMHN